MGAFQDIVEFPPKSTTLMFVSTRSLGRIPASRARTELQKAAFTEYQAKEKATDWEGTEAPAMQWSWPPDDRDIIWDFRWSWRNLGRYVLYIVRFFFLCGLSSRPWQKHKMPTRSSCRRSCPAALFIAGRGCDMGTGMGCVLLWVSFLGSCSLQIRCSVNCSERLFRSCQLPGSPSVPECKSCQPLSLLPLCPDVKILGSVAWMPYFCAILSLAVRTLQFEGLLKRLHHERSSLRAVGKNQVVSL